MSAVFKQCAVSAMTVAVLLFAGCSQSTAPPANNASEAVTKAAGPPQIVTAKAAFWPMYTSARSWATDVVALRLTSEEVPGFKNEDGKAAMWEATFASPSLHQYRVYSYAIAAVPPSVLKGVNADTAQPWGGETRDAMTVDLTLFNIDSDAAYKAASADADVWLKKNPNKGITTVELGDTFKFQGPVWYIMWGDKKSGYVAYVDATTGAVRKSK